MKKLITFTLLLCILVTLSGCTRIQRTESLDDYLQPGVPMSFSEFLLFPVRSALDECTVDVYRSVSVSDLLFDDNYLLLRCSYTQEQYDAEISRLEGIGAEYREDLFRFPAYVGVFITHSYEYALLEPEQLIITYVAAHTIYFENSDLENGLQEFPSQFAPIKFEGVDILIYDYGMSEGEIRIGDKTYRFFEHSPQKHWTLNGVPAHTGSLKQITALLEPCESPIPDFGEISAAREAAYYGATALQKRTPNWNSSEEIGLVHNETADVWIVHGLFLDRNTPGEAWAVVLEAATGKVLGFTELDSAE